MEYQKEIHGTQGQPSKFDLDFYKRQGTTQTPLGYDIKNEKTLYSGRNKEYFLNK